MVVDVSRSGGLVDDVKEINKKGDATKQKQ